MRIQCASHHLRCESSRRVATAARGVLDCRALVSEPRDGWVSVWDEDGCQDTGDDLPRVAAQLSERLQAACISFCVGEDGATRYWLHDSGKLVDSYVSRGSEHGDAPTLADYCLDGTNPDDLRDILDAETAFEQERIEALAEMLGIEPARASLSYDSIAEREEPEHEAPPDEGGPDEPEPEPEPELPLLHAAARQADSALVRLLLEEGAKATGRDHAGRSALHHCALSLTLDLETLDSGGRSEWWRRNAEARAAALEREEEPARAWERERRAALPPEELERGVHAAEALLEAGADVNAEDEKGERPLAVAAAEGHAPLVELFLRAGADVAATDGEGATALHGAASWGHEDLVTVLLEAGADSDPADSWGWTPLMLAAEAGYAETVRLLLEAGADPRRENGVGRSAGGIARDAGRTSLADRLREL